MFLHVFANGSKTVRRTCFFVFFYLYNVHVPFCFLLCLLCFHVVAHASTFFVHASTFQEYHRGGFGGGVKIFCFCLVCFHVVAHASGLC